MADVPNDAELLPEADGPELAPLADEPELNLVGLAAARRWAAWHLGSPSWGDQLLEAYYAAAEAHEELDAVNAPTYAEVVQAWHQ